MEYKRFEMSDDNYDVVLIVEGNRHTVQITKTSLSTCANSSRFVSSGRD